MSAKAPFDCSVHIGRQATIDSGAQYLFQGDVTGNHSVAKIAAEFGSRHVHIVSHSKGGLFVRRFLDDNARSDPSSQLSVISITTLDTPHQGSIMSDTVYLYNQGVHSVLGFKGRLGYGLGKLFTPDQLKNAFGPGGEDMTIGKMLEFNSNHKILPDHYQIQFQDQSGNTSSVTLTNPAYYSTSADADLNHDHQLQDSEAASYSASVARFSWNRIRTVMSFKLITDSQGRITAASANNSPTPIENDTAVSIDSARYPGFTEINRGPYRGNHASILCPGIGSVPAYCGPVPGAIGDVLTAIVDAEKKMHEEIR